MTLNKLWLATAIAVGLSAALAAPGPALAGQGTKDRTCVLDCREVFTQCSHAAYTEARMCVQSCGDLIAKARQICAESPGSEDCDSARREAAACVRECRATLGTEPG